MAAESFGHDGDAEAVGAFIEGIGISVHTRDPLTGIETVFTGKRLQKQRIIGNIGSHRPGMIYRRFDTHDPGIGHQAKGRFQTDDA